ncbi:uncharacterized protein TNCV_4837411 [Trichonephila clavipes]|nr:uncharacterized protein TNCV_4837411 [Trichonephila clavipes]
MVWGPPEILKNCRTPVQYRYDQVTGEALGNTVSFSSRSAISTSRTWLVTLTAVQLGLDSNPGEDMDVCKCIVPARHGGTLNSRRTASPLVRWWKGKEMEAPEHPRVFSLKIGVKNRFVTCMVLKATG